MIFSKAIAFIKRDYYIESSYKMAFLMSLITSIVPAFLYYFIAKLVSNNPQEKMSYYASDYYSFALVGVSMSTYFSFALSNFSNSIRRAQSAGCLEAILNTSTPPTTVIVLSSLYSFIVSTVYMVFTLLIGSLFLGFNAQNINIASTIVSVIFSVTSLIGLGVFSAATIVVFKRGEPLEFIFGSLCSLVAGAFFPINVLPEWLRIFSKLLPMTYSLEALRLSMLKGYGITLLWKEYLILFIATLILVPISMLIFNKAVEKARRDGSLLHY